MIIISHGQYDEAELADHRPRVVVAGAPEPGRHAYLPARTP